MIGYWRPSREEIEQLNKEYPTGTRIILHRMGDDPCPVEPGSTGTVKFVDDTGTIHCDFDNRRSLGLIPGVDSFEIMTDC